MHTETVPEARLEPGRTRTVREARQVQPVQQAESAVSAAQVLPGPRHMSLKALLGLLMPKVQQMRQPPQSQPLPKLQV